MPKMVSPAATILARTRTRATLLRRAALSLSIGLTSGLLALHHQQPLRFDTVPATTTTAQARSLASDHEPRRKELLDADTVKQLSGGSLSGFFAGLLVSVFSKTLVLIAGIAMVILWVAARNGIDLVQYLQLKQRVRSSRILAALNHHAAFKLSFAIAFTLSAFMSF